MWEAGNVALTGLVTGGIYALLAVGFTLVFSVSGILNLAQGSFVTLGALVFYSLVTQAHWSLPLALLGALGILTAWAAVMEWLVIRPALGQISYTNLLMLMGGFLILYEGGAFLLWGSNPYTLPPFTGAQPVAVGGLKVPTQAFWVLGTVLVVVVGLWYGLSRTTFGKAMRACSENPMAAELMGIPVPRMVLVSFSLAAALGVLAGAVILPLTSLDFGTMADYTNQGLIAVTVGGIGNFFGSVVGGVTLGVVEQFLSVYVSSLLSTALSLVVLLLILIFRPEGILGTVRGSRLDVAERGIGRGFLAPAIDPRIGRGAALVALVGLALLPHWLQGTGLLRAVNITGIFCLAVIGLDLLTGIAGQVSLGQAGFMAIGGYTAGILAVRAHVAPWAGTLAGVALSVAVALLLGLASVRVRGMYLAISTLAFGILVESLGNGLSITNGPAGLLGIPNFSLGGYVFASETALYYLIWGLVVVALFAALNLIRSHRGRALRAMHIDQAGAEALGVNTVRYKIQAFVFSAVLASIAGSLYAFSFQYLSPAMVGSQTSLDLMTMLVVGGIGTGVGPLLGVVLLTFLPQVSQSLASFKLLAEGLMLVVFLRYLPGGLWGTVLQGVSAASWRWWRASRAWTDPTRLDKEADA
ncbi:MAG: ABC transporter permease [Firmicutes bacterium]|nr:ABC transporter permease [Alicyclobacillaceae bacterium]MCL6496352.1 ABC transporter permease [Bacillota bacterium]